MGRKALDLRKAPLKKLYANRKSSLKKQLFELSTLCDTDALMIIYDDDPSSSSRPPEVVLYSPCGNDVSAILAKYIASKAVEMGPTKGGTRKRKRDVGVADVLGDKLKKVATGLEAQATGENICGLSRNTLNSKISTTEHIIRDPKSQTLESSSPLRSIPVIDVDHHVPDPRVRVLAEELFSCDYYDLAVDDLISWDGEFRELVGLDASLNAPAVDVDQSSSDLGATVSAQDHVSWADYLDLGVDSFCDVDAGGMMCPDGSLDVSALDADQSSDPRVTVLAEDHVSWDDDLAVCVEGFWNVEDGGMMRLVGSLDCLRGRWSSDKTTIVV